MPVNPKSTQILVIGAGGLGCEVLKVILFMSFFHIVLFGFQHNVKKICNIKSVTRAQG